MNAVKCALAITAGTAVLVLIGEVLLGLGPRDGGVVVAVVASCVLLRELVKAVQSDLDDQRRLDRKQVWARRDKEVSR